MILQKSLQVTRGIALQQHGPCCVQAADSNGTLPESHPSNLGSGGPASTSSDSLPVLDLDTDSPYISVRSSRQNSLGYYGPSSKDFELEASVLDALTDSVLTGDIDACFCHLFAHAW